LQVKRRPRSATKGWHDLCRAIEINVGMIVA